MIRSSVPSFCYHAYVSHLFAQKTLSTNVKQAKIKPGKQWYKAETWIHLPPQNANTIAITFHVFPDHRIIVVSLSNTENLLFVNQGEGKMTRNKNNTRKPPFIITIQVSSVLQSCSQRRTTTIIQVSPISRIKKIHDLCERHCSHWSQLNIKYQNQIFLATQIPLSFPSPRPLHNSPTFPGFTKCQNRGNNHDYFINTDLL